MLLIILVILMILPIGAVILARRINDDFDRPAAVTISIVLILAGIGGILGSAIGIMGGNLGTAAELEAFYNTQNNNYATTVQMTNDLLTVDTQKYIESNLIIEGSLEKIEVGKAMSERIAEWRDAVGQYNYKLQRFQAMDRNLMFGIYYPTMPEYMKPIVIE